MLSLSLLSIEGRVLDWCQAFDRLASVDAHLCLNVEVAVHGWGLVQFLAFRPG
jgi:hypothetical protein